jgi:DNA repair protein RAD16
MLPLTICEDDGKREWKPAEYETEPIYSHVVELAKTARARCRK